MRWEERLVDLFDDLEQQAEGLALAERDVEVAELSRAEYAQVDLAARLHASVGQPVRLVLAGVGPLEATVARVGSDWLLAEAGPQEWIVRTACLEQVDGLSDRTVAPEDRRPTSRLALGSALRGIAEARSGVVLHRAGGGSVRGQLRRIGADFAELWVDEQAESWTPGPAGAVAVVPFAALAAVRRT